MAFQPTQRDLNLGAALRAARTAAGLNQEQVAERLGLSQAKVSRFETARQEIPRFRMEELVDLYRPAPDLLAELESLATPPDVDDTDHPSPNRDFMALKQAEQDALEIRSAYGEGIPRQLQADQYMLVQSAKAGIVTSEARLLAEKRQRERLLSRDQPPRYFQLLSESSLYRVPGGTPELRREQARHLLSLVEKYQQLCLQVVTFDADLAHFNNMTVLSFADRRRNVVYLPNDRYGKLHRQPTADKVEIQWEKMRRVALSEEESQKFIHEIARSGQTR
ncbi:Scr1 family TA system antitoxin-like transcriptional regulator [Actinophytocola sediminis]